MTKPTPPFVTTLLPLILIAIWISGCTRSTEQSSQDSEEETSSANVAKQDVDRPTMVSLADAVGKRAPEIDLEVATGGPAVEKITLAQLKGKVVVLDYWATW